MSDTKRDFSTISIYIDENENMIGIPCGESDKYGIADIDKVLKHLIPTAKLKALLKRLFLIAIPKNTMILLRFQLLKSILKKQAL